VKQGADTGRRYGYASALAGLWSGLGATLTRLEEIAGRPLDELDDTVLQSLPVLQYSLHRASELAVGISPPSGAEAAHAELGAALAEARDATADVIEAFETDGAAAAAALLHEWRGALFRVRLARHRLGARPSVHAAAPREQPTVPWQPFLATILVASGCVAFASGAIVAAWPLWAAGLALVGLGFFVYRP